MKEIHDLSAQAKLDTDAAAQTTVVLITRNRRTSLARTLRRLEALPERPRVIVVDNASEDNTATFDMSGCPRVEVIALADNMGPVARTVGVIAAETPYVAFCDDDSWWRPGALTRAQEVFETHPRVAVIAARTLVGPERRDDPINDKLRASPLGRDPRLPGPWVLGFLACASVVRRSAFLQVGGFSESGMGFEEAALAIEMVRRGWAVVYVDDVVAEHHPTEANRDDRVLRRSHARNVVIAAWRRRPARRAVAQTLELLRHGVTDAATMRGVLDAALQVRRLRRERDVVHESLEASLRRLEL